MQTQGAVLGPPYHSSFHLPAVLPTVSPSCLTTCRQSDGMLQHRAAPDGVARFAGLPIEPPPKRHIDPQSLEPAWMSVTDGAISLGPDSTSAGCCISSPVMTALQRKQCKAMALSGRCSTQAAGTGCATEAHSQLGADLLGAILERVLRLGHRPVGGDESAAAVRFIVQAVEGEEAGDVVLVQEAHAPPGGRRAAS